MKKVRVAVVGAGAFGKNHLRVLHEGPGAELVAVVDTDPDRAQRAAQDHGCKSLEKLDQLYGQVDAAVVAVPTVAHADVGCQLLEHGIDVLMEKPIAADLESAKRLTETAETHGRILQIGHLERFNPAVQAMQQKITLPLFFEIHRMRIHMFMSLRTTRRFTQ